MSITIKSATLHLTLLVECSVINFIKKDFRFMIRVKLYWLLLGKINLKFELNELPKVSVVVFGKEKPPDFSLMKICWSFDAVPKSFAAFELDFCIKYFNDLQNSEHEKRLETEASSLRNPVIMRGIKSRLTFGDRCSTN